MGLLTTRERANLIDMLLDLPNIQDPGTRQLLTVNLPRGLQRFLAGAAAPAVHIANIVDAANNDTWAQLPDGSWTVMTVIDDAIFMVRGSRLESDLRQLLRKLEARAEKQPLILQTPAQTGNERIIRKRLPFLDVSIWYTSLMRSAHTVCRVETPDEFGTGFLVGANLLLTCHHVVAGVLSTPALREEVILRFDFTKAADGTTTNEGQEYHLAAGTDWAVDSDSELDFALLKIAGNPGDDAVGGQTSGPKRGWLRPILSHTFKLDDPLSIIQHPRATPLKLAFDTEAIIGPNNDGTRIMYKTNTEPGSSGSPCFTINWELVAMHRRGDTNEPSQFNEGVPLNLVCLRPKVQDVLNL